MKIELTRENLIGFLNSEAEKRCKEANEVPGNPNTFSWLSLTRQAGVKPDTIRDFLRAKSQVPRADKLQKILGALGYDIILQKRDL